MASSSNRITSLKKICVAGYDGSTPRAIVSSRYISHNTTNCWFGVRHSALGCGMRPGTRLYVGRLVCLTVPSPEKEMCPPP